jgi:hypothetical protein
MVMAFVDWRIRGPEIANCNCDWGCPCQFNALPTNGFCSAMVAMHIEEGWFGDVPLDGLRWAGLFSWLGPIHMGGGEAQVMIDECATEAQRTALLTILSGAETDPGATIFNVFSAVIDTHYEPLFLPIEFELDMDRRRGFVKVPGLLDTRVEPITNPVTGAEHRVRVSLPDGFEYREAEYCSGATRAAGPIPLELAGTHAHVAALNLSTHGVG